MHITVGPVGNIVQGDVLDVNKSSLERALKDYDHLLYLKWNPTKMRGHGCWEVRRKPTEKIAVYHGEIDGLPLYSLESHEIDLVNHVMDSAFLNYNILLKLNITDTFKVKNYVDELEKHEAQVKAEKERKAKAELAYGLKQIKSQAAGLRELALSGANLNQLAKHWK